MLAAKRGQGAPHLLDVGDGLRGTRVKQTPLTLPAADTAGERGRAGRGCVFEHKAVLGHRNVVVTGQHLTPSL